MKRENNENHAKVTDQVAMWSNGQEEERGKEQEVGNEWERSRQKGPGVSVASSALLGACWPDQDAGFRTFARQRGARTASHGGVQGARGTDWISSL